MSQSVHEYWDLERVFPGGSQSDQFIKFLHQLRSSLAELERGCDQLHRKYSKRNPLIKEQLLLSQTLYEDWTQAFEFIQCLKGQDAKDQQAQSLDDEINSLSSLYKRCQTKLDETLAQLSDTSWRELLSQEELRPIAFILEERRTLQQTKLRSDVEKAFQSVEGDGLHAWGALYHTIVGRMKVYNLPVAQAVKTVYYGANRPERIALFQKWKEAWGREADLCAKAINHIAGFRLNVYSSRGWSSTMQETLLQNRIKEETVQAMWDALCSYKQPLLKYLERKKQLWKAEHLCWSDQFAPITVGKERPTNLTFSEAVAFIEEHLRSFDAHLADFVAQAIQERWVDACQSSRKRVGAFCAPLPKLKESRIMLTFHHDLPSTGVLAHELGHAYHYHILQELPAFLQSCPPTIAEIASTLTETILMKAAMEKTDDEGERLQLIDNQLIRDVGTLLNSQVRYLFETRFYEKRRGRTLSVEDLNQLMIEAQEEVFDGKLATYEPTFWASLRHFYMTRTPFVHYPYTVAHLISTGFYAQLKNESSRGDRLRHLLQDSTQMTVEDLGYKHLGVDLTKHDFWLQALDSLYENVKVFMDLTERYV